ncbi:peptide/nickel transport system substrate-binding protein [Paucibacter oligotrophus]|uniref:Peptide/nickel transport system substrate-binding protein n=1 Tax=Roseateles oligotrophus TaxID=1769250 RepID=A0A840LD96_9BURK|nr:ABC transporter substrate-binding protein [Roseateles oligotrophus]MBB4844653.1 peptide/nickel transport system substrate-binding protein [Roseateles oligotrophus]
MKKYFLHPQRLRLLACLTLLAGGAASAQTLRWAASGDPLTLDPYAQNETLTNVVNAQVYEFLVARDKKLNLVPLLATEWKQNGPLKWTFKLRPGVKFHDGRPFSAEDVVFSLERAQQPSSQIAVYANALGRARALDKLTVEFTLSQVNPIFLQHLNTLYIMSKGWAEANKATKTQDFANKEESYAAFNANGTGPFQLMSRAPDSKTVFKRNPNYWGQIEGNLQEVVYTPIKSDATRTAALVSGELDFVLDPAPRDIDKLAATPGVKIVNGPENRIIFLGLDQGRSELQGSNIKGKNPFKDVRVRRALYQAIDIETIKSKLMNGQSAPTGALVPSPLGAFNDPAIEARLPYDPAAAKRLLAEAGYAGGFEFTLDCTNNRYVNDERICITLASQWAKIGLKTRVNAQPKAIIFNKLEKLDTNAYLFGWGGSITDPESIFSSHYRNRGEKGVGEYNRGNFRDDTLDALVAASSKEADPAKREALIRQIFKREAEQIHYIPLHRQFIPWAARNHVTVVHRPDNWLEWRWVVVK